MQKTKLKKIAELIQNNLALIEAAEKTKNTLDITPVLYENGLNLLIDRNKLTSKQTAKNKFLKAKMVRSAKNLTSQFEDCGLDLYLQNFETALAQIQHLGGPFNLLPHQEEIDNLITLANKNLSEKTFNLYNSMLTDMFNVGRTHQEIVAEKRTNGLLGLKKYAYNFNDAQTFEKLNSYLSAKFNDKLLILQSNLKKATTQTLESNQKNLVESLHDVYGKFSFEIEKTLRQHAWKSYSAGNLYQLVKEQTKMVAWKTSHQIDDCIHCRAIETGEIVLQTREGTILPYKRRLDRVSYNIEDVLKYSEFEGLSYFGHDDCRCFWVAAN